TSGGDLKVNGIKSKLLTVAVLYSFDVCDGFTAVHANIHLKSSVHFADGFNRIYETPGMPGFNRGSLNSSTLIFTRKTSIWRSSVASTSLGVNCAFSET